ncbi:MAG TPA: cytochrome c biogenesis protein CcsA [Ilumatobacteraceae bacterium]|nr:cytochrome c biogenesis protein CcsA [Ilumatobacteraceae bacterium]
MTTTDTPRTTERTDEPAPRRGTGTRGTRVIGIATIVAMAWLVAFGLLFSPEDRDQRESVRLLYVHVPTIWIAYLAFTVTAIASGMYLFRKSLGWDRLAGASAEIGTVFVAVTLIVGALWGRLTWGVFWQWDARLTTTALLFVTYIGYLAVRRLGGTHQQRARRSAVIGLIAVLEIPLVHWSVRLWRSLHQEASVLSTDGDIRMDGLMLFSLFVGVIAFSLLYVWLVMHRTRVMAMEDLLDDRGLDEALAARRVENDRTPMSPDARFETLAGEPADVPADVPTDVKETH